MRLKSYLLDLLFPPRCPFCYRIGERSGVCPACKQKLIMPEDPLRKLREGLWCAAPLQYEGQTREGLLRFKFRGAESAAEPLGAMLAECAAQEFPGEFDMLTWVPVSRKRRRSRGYDQAQLLARSAGRTLGMKPVRLLKKVVNNPAQSGLRDAAARRANVLGVYDPVHPEKIAGHRILLVDDICTTGATLMECARVLEDAGAVRVRCAVVAQTPEKQGDGGRCGGNTQENGTKSR